MSITTTLNYLLARFGISLVNTAILYEWQKGGSVYSTDLRLPPGAVEYLDFENPRLLDLRQRYQSYQNEVSTTIVWTDEYVRSYSLQSFRGDNCYVWQTHDRNCSEINYCLTYYYVHTIDSLGVLDKSVENCLFGAHAFLFGKRWYSRDLFDSTIELNFLEKHIEISKIDDLTIIDIGAGYGRLAVRATNSLPNLGKYICADAVPESTFLCEYYVKFNGLTEKVNVAPLDRIEHQMQDQHINLAVNIHSFSECTLETIDWWLQLLATNNVRYIFIVPNASDHGGENLALNNGKDFSFLFSNHGYELKVKAPKYQDTTVQLYGVSPTWYFLFELKSQC